METILKNLDTLAAFHSVAVHESFTGAARELGLAKSQVSKQVMRLEALISCKLFHRTTRKIALTEEGRRLLEFSTKILELSRDGERSVRALGQGETGTVRLSVPPGLARIFYQSLLPELTRRLPEVRFHSNASDEVLDLWGDEVDFAIRATRDHRPEVIAKYLGEVKDVICASPKFLAKFAAPSDPAWLSTIPCILYSGDALWNTWSFDSKRGRVKVDVRGNQITDSYPSALSLCLAGLGVARIPAYLAVEALQKCELVELFPRLRISTHPLYLVHLANHPATKKHAVLKAEILKWFRDRPEYFLK